MKYEHLEAETQASIVRGRLTNLEAKHAQAEVALADAELEVKLGEGNTGVVASARERVKLLAAEIAEVKKQLPS